MKDLTEKQQAVLDFIAAIIRERGFPPTIREIGDQFGITAKGAYDHLKAIEKKGYLKTSKNQSRAIELVRHSPDAMMPGHGIGIPLLGQVAAGLPILAEENIESYITVPEEMVHGNALYALRVVGESMIEAGIQNGDIAIIEKRDFARNGETVVAMIDEEATLKVYYKESDHVRLEARNPEFKPIKAKDVQILGKLAGIYRIYN